MVADRSLTAANDAIHSQQTNASWSETDFFVQNMSLENEIKLQKDYAEFKPSLIQWDYLNPNITWKDSLAKIPIFISSFFRLLLDVKNSLLFSWLLQFDFLFCKNNAIGLRTRASWHTLWIHSDLNHRIQTNIWTHFHGIQTVLWWVGFTRIHTSDSLQSRAWDLYR